MSPVDEDKCPDARMRLPVDWDRTKKSARNVEIVQGHLRGLDMKLAKTIEIPRTLTCDPQIINASGQCYARADTGALTDRKKSTVAKAFVAVLWDKITDSFLRDEVRTKMLDTVYILGGAEYTLGRLQEHYPARGYVCPNPVTADEARVAFVNCGYDPRLFQTKQVLAYPLLPDENRPDEYIKINKIADNGFPVGLNMKNEEAKVMVYGLARTVRNEIVTAFKKMGPKGVQLWKKDKESGQPWMTAVKGKLKNDYYTKAKVFSKQCRLYNVLPKQCLLNMQVAMQPFTKTQRNILNADCHTMYGASLSHGGADRLFHQLEEQLRKADFAFVHNGDDAVVAFRDGHGRLHIFELDFSSMDITEERNAFAEIHNHIHRWAEMVDGPSAALWYAFVRERVVVVTGNQARVFKHGGSSGIPGQGVINDMGCDVTIQRVGRVLTNTEELTEQVVTKIVKDVAWDMGLKAKVDNYHIFDYKSLPAVNFDDHKGTLYEALQTHHVKFLGYNFYSTEGHFYCYVDIPRMMSQLPWPRGAWYSQGRSFEVAEAIRIGSIMLNIGIVPDDLTDWHRSAVTAAIDLLNNTMVKWPEIDGDEARFADAFEGIIYGVETSEFKSMLGLRNALARHPGDLWIDEKKASTEQPLPVFQAVGVAGHTMSWADDEDDVIETLKMLIVPEKSTDTTPAYVYTGDTQWRSSTRPATLKNDGRPPPSKVWGPAKPKRQDSKAGSAPRRKAGGNAVISRALAEEDEQQDQGYNSREESDDHSDQDADESEYDTSVAAPLAMSAREEDKYVSWAQATSAGNYRRRK